MKGKVISYALSALFILAVVAIAFRITKVKNFVTNTPAV